MRLMMCFYVLSRASPPPRLTRQKAVVCIHRITLIIARMRLVVGAQHVSYNCPFLRHLLRKRDNA